MFETVISDLRWIDYDAEPNAGRYKGYWMKDTLTMRSDTGTWHLTFTNGEEEITATGVSENDAFMKIFDQIDRRREPESINRNNDRKISSSREATLTF